MVLLESANSRNAMPQRQTSGTRHPAADNAVPFLQETKSILHLVQDKSTGSHILISIYISSNIMLFNGYIYI